jgi:predicted permease
MRTLFQDLRYSLRAYSKSGAFSLIAVLTVAFGIGATTAAFSIVNTILLKPLPYPNAERIVIPWRLPPPTLTVGYSEIPWGRADALFFINENTGFESFGAFKPDFFNYTGVGDPVRLDGLRASVGFFRALDVAPALGRIFTVEEDQPGHEQEAILSYELWQDRFAGDRGIIGKAINLNNSEYTVVGVMPAGFSFPHGPEMPGIFNFPKAVEIWVPLAMRSGGAISGELLDLAVIGRLKSGITVSQAQNEMDILGKRLQAEHPRAKDWYHSRVTSLTRQVTGVSRLPLLLILATVGTVLLIACSNVANMLLARLFERKREFTLRMALGAKHGRLIRQILTESVTLAACAGMAGIALASTAIFCVKIFGPTDIPRLRDVGIDVRVFSFAIGLTFVTGILLGLAPAIGATRLNLIDSLKEGSHRAGGILSGARTRQAILVSQIAFAVVLVIAASLLTQTFIHVVKLDPGFNAESVLTFELSLPRVKYKEHSQIVALYKNTLQQLRSIPAVRSVGLVETIPMAGATESTMVLVPGRINSNPKESLFANYTITSPGYFAALKTPILRGRDFLDSDTESSMPVTIISATMAAKFWPGQDPIGKQMRTPTIPTMSTIIGIVPDVKHLSLRETSDPEMYVPFTQQVYPSMLTMDILLRSQVDPTSMTDSVRAAVRSIDPDLPIAKVVTLKTLVDDSIAQQRLALYLIGILGLLALGLTSVGMYGVISYSVVQRTQEIGVRMAMGAQRQDISKMVLREGTLLACVGTITGVAAALGVTHLMASFLYGVKATDPLTFIAVAVFLIAIALLACYVPARRATRVDPTVALRCE